MVQVQLCKYFIEIGDSERESAVWGEINVLRFAMLEYGTRSPIGSKSTVVNSVPQLSNALFAARQEKVLQGLMQEIVRMTAQQQPLEVGLPLYHFSHATLFRKGEPPQGDSAAGVPLPISPSFEEQHLSPTPSNALPAYGIAEVSHARSSSSASWSVHEMSVSPMNGM